MASRGEAADGINYRVAGVGLAPASTFLRPRDTVGMHVYGLGELRNLVRS